jgi:hypothetical protein
MLLAIPTMLRLGDNAARFDRNSVGKTGLPKMITKLTRRERATILAALRRWLSYPAAREADSIATNGGKQKPLDNAEIERLCRRISELAGKRDPPPVRVVTPKTLPIQSGVAHVCTRMTSSDNVTCVEIKTEKQRQPKAQRAYAALV